MVAGFHAPGVKMSSSQLFSSAVSLPTSFGLAFVSMPPMVCAVDAPLPLLLLPFLPYDALLGSELFDEEEVECFLLLLELRPIQEGLNQLVMREMLMGELVMMDAT